MRIVEAGHVYEAENVDGPGSQRIAFVRRRDPAGEPLPMAQRAPGMLTQELLRIAIDRTLYLYAEAPCDEDTKIVEKLRECLALYESRAARRIIERTAKPETLLPCSICGHVLCGHLKPQPPGEDEGKR